MHTHAQHTIHKHCIHFGWDNSLEPKLRIAPGDTVDIETLDASAGQLNPASTAEALNTLDMNRVNPVTGPIYVEGAEPGDALKVTIHAFRPSGWGWTGNIPGFGLLADQFPETHLHHWKYDPNLTPALYGPGGRVPLRPFVGTIGTALAEPGCHSVIPPRHVGGNMDVRDLAQGSTLYLPVEVAGGLLSFGDTHAAQGDGEVCGTAIESPIDATIQVELVKDARLRLPRFTTPGPASPKRLRPLPRVRKPWWSMAAAWGRILPVWGTISGTSSPWSILKCAPWCRIWSRKKI